MADTFSLRFEIDASSAEAGAKKFVSAINTVTKSLSTMDASAAAAFSKLSAGASGDFSAVAKQLAKLSGININPQAAKSITSLGTAFASLKAPSPTAIKNITTFADVVPKLLNSFSVSGNFAASVNSIGNALGNFKVPTQARIDALANFGKSLQQIAPSLKITGNFSGISNLGASFSNFKAPSETAVSNIKAFFNALNSGGSKVSITAAMVNGISNLGNSLAGFKAPSATAVTNIKNLFAALSTFKTISGVNSLTTMAAAFANFKGPTAAQTTNVKNFVTAIGALKVPTNAAALSAYLNTVAGAAGNANKALSTLKANISGLGSGGGSGGAASGISHLTGEMRGLENAFSGTFQAASVFRTLIGSITIGSLSKSLYDANIQLMGFKSTLLAANSGDVIKTGEDLRYVGDMANRLGQSIGTLQKSYGGFAISSQLAGVSTENTRKSFEAIVTAMTVLHRTSDQTSLALLAVEQMMSKGTVSSEELRRQLGEQLPGAVNLMARALKVSTAELQKMLKAGAILSADALPKFADEIQKTYGGSLQLALKNANSQFNLLSNSITDIFQVIGQSGVMSGLAAAIANVTKSLSDPAFLGFASEFGARVGNILPIISSGFSFLVKNVDYVIDAFKILLALNITRFFQGFIGVLIGGAGSLKAWGAAFSTLMSVFGPAQKTIAGVTAGITLLGRAAAVAEVLTGPIGAVVIGLGVLATAFMTSSKSVTDFTEGLDVSKAALDRYNDSIQEFTTAQLKANAIELNKKLQEIADQADQARAKFKQFTDVINQAGQYQKTKTEVQTLAKTIADSSKVIDSTNGSYDNLIKNLSANVQSPAAKAYLNDFINMRAEIDKTAPAVKLFSDELKINQQTMDGMNAANAVSQLNAVGTAAANMAGIVATATAELVKVLAQSRMNEAQLAVGPQLDSIAKESSDAAAKINGAYAGQDVDKQLSRVEKGSADAIAQVTTLGKRISDFKNAIADNKSGRTIIDNISEGADTVKTKIAAIQKQITLVKNTPYEDTQKKSDALDVLNQRLVEAQAGPKKKKGGGGSATDKMLNGLDPSGETAATAKLTSEEDKLNKLLKANKITADQYGSAMTTLRDKMKGTAEGQNALTAEFEKLKNELNPSTSKLVEFKDKLNILHDAMDSKKISMQEYLDLLLKLKKAYAGTAEDQSQPGFVRGINKGLLDLTKTGDDFVNDIAATTSSAFNSLSDALTSWVTTGKFDFKSLTASILGDIAKIVIQYSVIQPLIKALSGAFGGSGGILGSLFGGGASSTFTPNTTLGGFLGVASAKGNIFNSGNLVPFANGGLTNGSNNGILTSPTLFDMAGSKTGLAGEAGPEAIMPLTRGPDGSLGVKANGAVTAASQNVVVQPQVNVNIQSPQGTTSSVSQKPNSNGGVDLNVLIEQIKDSVAGDIAKGGTPLNRAMESRYATNAAAGNKR